MISLEEFIKIIIKNETIIMDTPETFNETIHNFLESANSDYKTARLLRKATPILGAVAFFAALICAGSISYVDAEILASKAIQSFLPGAAGGIAAITGIFSVVAHSSAKDLKSKIENDKVKKNNYIKKYNEDLDKKRTADIRISRLVEYTSPNFLSDHPIISSALKARTIDPNDKALCDSIYSAIIENVASLDAINYSLGINTYYLLSSYLNDYRQFVNSQEPLGKKRFLMTKDILKKIETEARENMHSGTGQADPYNTYVEPQYAQTQIN